MVSLLLKYKGHFNPAQLEVSMMVFPSLETTYKSDRDVVYNSMHMDNNYNNFYSSNNSLDVSLYRPNVGSIPLRTLKEFPFLLPVKVEDLAHNSKKKGNYNKFDDRGNKTFMMTSFDKLNSSGHDEYGLYGYKHRKLKKEGGFKVNVRVT